MEDERHQLHGNKERAGRVSGVEESDWARVGEGRSRDRLERVSVVGRWEIREWILHGQLVLVPKEHYILPQSLTLPVDSLKITIVTPYVRGRSSRRRASLLRSFWLGGRGSRVGRGGGSTTISFVGRFGRVGKGDLVDWTEHVAV